MLVWYYYCLITYAACDGYLVIIDFINYISLDRNIYKRLQESNFVSFGLAKEDKTPSMLYFIQEMEKINNGELSNDAALYVDNFLSTLGVTQYYPHKDNTYKGELNG